MRRCAAIFSSLLTLTALAVPAGNAVARGAPALDWLSPHAGSTVGHQRVLVAGSGLTADTVVRFGRYASKRVDVVSPTRLVATAPALSAHTVDVTVSTAAGTSAVHRQGRYTYRSPGSRAPFEPYAFAPREAESARVDAVPQPSCPTAGWCAAIGPHFAGTQVRIYARHRWLEALAPLPADAAAEQTDPELALTAVSCPAPGWCGFIGTYVPAQTDRFQDQEWMLIVDDHGAWTATALRAVVPSSRYANLAQISCAAEGSCLAIGNADEAGYAMTLADGGWTAAPVPVPAVSRSTTTDPLVVDCPSVDWCGIVGAYDSGPFSHRTAFVTLADGVMTARDMPLPRGGKADHTPLPVGFDCPAPHECSVTGNYDMVDGYPGMYLNTFDHARQIAIAIPAPVEDNWRVHLRPTGLSCPTAKTCSVSVFSTRTVFDDRPYIQALVATHVPDGWRQTRLPLPSAVKQRDIEVGSLSCPTADFCMAAGSYSIDTLSTRPLVWVYANGVWTPIEPPDPFAPETPGRSYLLAATCPAVQTCLIDGYRPESASSAASFKLTTLD